VSITAYHDGSGQVVVDTHRPLIPDESAALRAQMEAAEMEAREYAEPGVCRSCRSHRYNHLPCGWRDRDFGDLRPVWFRRPNGWECDAIRNCPAWQGRAGE
jgi:hypothetical protein